MDNSSNGSLFRFSGKLISLYSFFLLSLLMLLFSSCGKGRVASFAQGSCERTFVGQREQQPSIALEKQQDLPVPVGFSLYDVTETSSAYFPSSPKTVLFSYVGNLSIDNSVHFYKQSMEFNGWEIEDFSSSKEGLLICNKAHKSCAISIRPVLKRFASHKTELYISLHKEPHEASTTLQTCSDAINSKTIKLS